MGLAGDSPVPLAAPSPADVLVLANARYYLAMRSVLAASVARALPAGRWRTWPSAERWAPRGSRPRRYRALGIIPGST